MKLSDYNYTYPKELIAQHPPKQRGVSRMMVVNIGRENFSHHRITDLPKFLSKGDVLILNDSKVIPARLIGEKSTGGKISILLLQQLNPKNQWKAIATRIKRLKTGEKIKFSKKFTATIEGRDGDCIILEFEKTNIDTELKKFGLPPLPPYIDRSSRPKDKSRYQTVYAKNSGSAAAPTAGLHFTKKLLKRIRNKGVEIGHVTLHVGLDTFSPVRVEKISDHKIHGERIIVPKATASLVNRAKREGRRIIAVGTTSVRALESSYKNGKCIAQDMTTDLFITPGYKFKAVDAILTNFHQPRTTLLMLISAIAGRKLILKCYKEAIKKKYRFFSYGDCMLISE